MGIFKRKEERRVKEKDNKEQVRGRKRGKERGRKRVLMGRERIPVHENVKILPASCLQNGLIIL